MSTLLIFTIFPALLALVLFIYAVLALREHRWLGSISRLLIGLLLLSLAALSATISLATQGYRALTTETLAATVVMEKLAPQLYRANFEFPDGSLKSFELSGDELYVDANILKWRPIVNVLGLRTGYELDRVAGRYSMLDNEQTKQRTVFSLATKKPLNLATMVGRYEPLKLLVDAEYGSATFVSIDDKQRYAILVSNSGLLVRPLD